MDDKVSENARPRSQGRSELVTGYAWRRASAQGHDLLDFDAASCLPAAVHVCRHGVLGCVQVGRTHHRNRADHDPRRVPDLRYSQGPALAALASVDTRSRKLGHPRSGSDLFPTMHPATSAGWQDAAPKTCRA